ncbi:hypothetical protein FA95DRAFT_1555122 [Auriscalpium vulgare]|uniref:Uncharacterized protein n=1 Tax=Auriscalpium vulgare TaxID=40419 RepID=A0ACB8S4P4_9AGAM|nr:hypothetical protein FA95DRAFT_1555122 [Auriscalpium vulgare]
MENIDYGRFRIGSSSDTCACCERWLRAASRALKRGFIVQSTGRFHGDWAISGAAQPCLLRRCDDNAQVIVTQNLVSRFDDWDSYNDISEDAPTETVLQREDSPLGSTVGKTSPTSDLTPSESS